MHRSGLSAARRVPWHRSGQRPVDLAHARPVAIARRALCRSGAAWRSPPCGGAGAGSRRARRPAPEAGRPALFTRRPVSTRPPRESSSDRRAAMMAPLPPSTTGHPTWCAMAVKSRGKTPESGAVSGSIEWAAVPATRARPSSVENRSAIRLAELSPRSPNPAAARGCAGTERMEPRKAGRILSRSRTSGEKMRGIPLRPPRVTRRRSRRCPRRKPRARPRAGGQKRPTEPAAGRRAREIDLGEGRGGEQQRVHGGADVVAEARKRQLGRAAAPTRLFRRLVDVHHQAGARQGEGCDQPVGARTDDDGVRSPHGCVTAPASCLPRRP